MTTPPRISATDTDRIKSRLGAAFLALSIVLGLAQIFACRYQLNPDAMDYLDIARQISLGHWSAVANGYWGTLTSVVMAPMFVLHPSAQWELPLAHFHGMLALLAAFFAFQWLLREFLRTLRERTGSADESLPEWAFWLLGYGIFVWVSFNVVFVESIGADFLVTLFVYLGAAALLRLKPQASFSAFLLFGFVLGAGYWSKAIMFPTALVFLAVSIIKAPCWKKNVTSMLAFALIAAPLLAALSIPRGRFTFGDSGKLNYATFVSPAEPTIHWQGETPGGGTPKHPDRLISGPVPVYEFNGPVAGTYPPSYDPSYWNEGRKPTFNLRAQIVVFLHHIPNVFELLFLAQPPLTAGFIFLALWSGTGFVRRLAWRWDLFAVSFAIIGLYMLVHFETRFAAAFLALIWLSAFASLRISSDLSSRRTAGICVVALVSIIVLSITSEIARRYINGCPDSALVDVHVAQQLNLPAGTPVAVVGPGNFAYWAHLAQLRIVSEVPDVYQTAFWRLPADKRQQVYQSLGKTGATWLIAEPPAVLIGHLDEGWQPIGDTGHFRYRLQ